MLCILTAPKCWELITCSTKVRSLLLASWTRPSLYADQACILSQSVFLKFKQ